MNNPKVSVIIPVYNAEKYLHRCIDSVLSQTFTDFELLLIDDGSTDSSGEICDKYTTEYTQIRAFHQRNGGVSSARNMGLDRAIGKWITFVDSDDYILKDYLKTMIENIKYEDSLILSNYRPLTIKLDNFTVSGIEMIRYFIENNLFVLSAPYSKLYNKSIIDRNHIRFPLGVHMGEDAIFILRYINSINTATLINQSYYHVNQVVGSLSSHYYTFESEWECYSIWRNEMLQFVTKHEYIYNNPIEIIWKNQIGNAFNRCLQCLYRQNTKLSIREQVKTLKEIPQKDYKEYKKYYHPVKLRRKFLKILITYRLFHLYALIGIFDTHK